MWKKRVMTFQCESFLRYSKLLRAMSRAKLATSTPNMKACGYSGFTHSAIKRFESVFHTVHMIVIIVKKLHKWWQTINEKKTGKITRSMALLFVYHIWVHMNVIHQVRGQHYDLVLNRIEIAGSSIKIHNAELKYRVNMCFKITRSMAYKISKIASSANIWVLILSSNRSEVSTMIWYWMGWR